MAIQKPKPFTFEAGNRAVLLLHGFTGHSADVRMIARYLETKGYTSHAPIYRGHGSTPEDLLTANPNEWWEDTLKAYDHLKKLGYEKIAVAGLSMGGALGLKLAGCREVTAVIPMCTPMFFDNETELKGSFKTYAREYKRYEKKDNEKVDQEVTQLLTKSEQLFNEIEQFIDNVRDSIDLIYTPTMVAQARLDKVINPESANYIYENIEADEKKLIWYEESGHAITFDKERDQLHEDIYRFLEDVSWE